MSLSELECAVLGVIWQRGPCSAYAVRKEFEPVSSGWSASAGSIYPLIARLLALDLLSARQESWGSKNKQLLKLTRKGRTQLRAWIKQVPDWAGNAAADPIRTRSFFLGALATAEDRVAFAESALTHTRKALDELKAYMDSLGQDDTSYERLGLLGAVGQLQARARWLLLVIDAMRTGTR